MIPKAQILQIATNLELQPTTVQKDYVLGWLLRSISEHPILSQWAFKGGTCLKKCYFETYRFSEDIDFSVPENQEVNLKIIETSLDEVTSTIESLSGITFPKEEWKLEEYLNKRGNISYQVKIPFNGPLNLPKKSLQRIKFDITQDELIADKLVLRALHHNYIDGVTPTPELLCYSIDEILAEKTRALVERNGRARDVYDVVNISRNFRSIINAENTVSITKRKFDFKGLQDPEVEYILDAIDIELLKANWDNQLAHQINSLPPVESYISDLKDAIAWWLKPEIAQPELDPMPQLEGVPGERQFFPTISAEIPPSALDYIRRAARNRLLVLIEYKGSRRLIEPYSIRYPSTDNEILHAWEVRKNSIPSNAHKSFVTNRITYLETTNQTFTPKWMIEL